MKRVRRRITFFAWLPLGMALFLGAVSSVWANVSHNVPMQHGAGVSIRVISTYEGVPNRGYLPVRIHISNHSGEERTWHFMATAAPSFHQQKRASWSGTFTVEHQGDREIDVYIPLFPVDLNYAQPQVQIRVSGYATTGSSMVQQYTTRSGGMHHHHTARNGQLMIGMSQGMIARNRGPFEESLSSRSRGAILSSVLPDGLSADPQGYAALDVLILSDADWRRLTTHQTAAIRQWVRLGGRLYVTREAGDASVNLPQGDAAGFGQAEFLNWTDAVFDANKLAEQLLRMHSLDAVLRDAYGHAGWRLADSIPHISYPLVLILGFVIVFAALLGPVNLFIASRRKKHAQILWTTPLLSLSASVILSIVIVASDGFGGKGERMAAVFLKSDEQHMAILQEQVSRTGMLFNRSFALQDRAVMYPLQVDVLFYNRNRDYHEEGGVVSGSWFTSRAIQGQLIQHSEPTRERIEIGATDDGLEIQSSLRNPVERLFYLDETNRWWMVEDIRVGERKAMSLVPASDFNNWYHEIGRSAGSRIQQALQDVRAKPGMFYAVSRKGEGVLVETIESVKWTDHAVIWVGPALLEGGARP